ncbi:hypothetical protein HYC85_028748 [Camellia sinensis]|uniref:Uncharacterized protein n=1 Tax=Camellia sinensis TaxID=4442 RepID=A0A7J7FWR5_CAMSI|nr:hypothetical protein HYC85_028748 [Camellia sinensis]
MEYIPFLLPINIHIQCIYNMVIFNDTNNGLALNRLIFIKFEMKLQNLRCRNSISTAHNEALEVITNFGEELRPKSQWIWRNQREKMTSRERSSKFGNLESFRERERERGNSNIFSNNYDTFLKINKCHFIVYEDSKITTMIHLTKNIITNNLHNNHKNKIILQQKNLYNHKLLEFEIFDTKDYSCTTIIIKKILKKKFYFIIFPKFHHFKYTYSNKYHEIIFNFISELAKLTYYIVKEKKSSLHGYANFDPYYSIGPVIPILFIFNTIHI